MKQVKNYATSTEYWQDPNKNNIQIANCAVHDYAADTEHEIGKPVVYYIKHGEAMDLPEITVEEAIIITQAEYNSLLAGNTITNEDYIDLSYNPSKVYYIKAV